MSCKRCNERSTAFSVGSNGFCHLNVWKCSLIVPHRRDSNCNSLLHTNLWLMFLWVRGFRIRKTVTKYIHYIAISDWILDNILNRKSTHLQKHTKLFFFEQPFSPYFFSFPRTVSVIELTRKPAERELSDARRRRKETEKRTKKGKYEQNWNANECFQTLYVQLQFSDLNAAEKMP